MNDQPTRPSIAERIKAGTFGEKKRAHGDGGGRDVAPAHLSADEAVSWHQKQIEKESRAPRRR